MTDRIDITEAESRNNVSYMNAAFQETLSDKISALRIGGNTSSQEPDILDFNTGDIYHRAPGAPYHWYPIVESTSVSSARTGADSSHENSQSDELNESFTSRMNREDDRQPYLDSQRHQDEMPAHPSNEVTAGTREDVGSRIIRIDDPQPEVE